MEGTIAFPAASSTEDIRVWGHGPANGTVQINDNQSVSYSCQQLPENTELSIRLLLPSDLFTMPTTSGNELDAIVAEEETMCYKRKHGKIGSVCSGLLGQSSAQWDCRCYLADVEGS